MATETEKSKPTERQIRDMFGMEPQEFLMDCSRRGLTIPEIAKRLSRHKNTIGPLLADYGFRVKRIPVPVED